jgi:mRNA-degrading endonuclease RelE of RelBE toxin-antitoxin system
MLPNFLMQKMVETQLKSLPEGQREKMVNLIHNNPDFFKEMAEDLQKELASGKDNMTAAMIVARKNEARLKVLLEKNPD